jgi:IclR family transcriptional regulator, KDG regulon repressor
MSYTVSAVDRALLILECLAENPDVTLTELAERTGNTSSLTFRFLHTLQARGYVHKDAARRTYSLGYRALFLADHARRGSRLIAAAEPHLDALAAETGENVLLVTREDLASVCVAMRESRRPLRLYAEVGKAGPLHAGGGPKVLLAYAPPAVQEAVLRGKLEGYTPTSIVEPQKLARALDAIRRTGWAFSVGELDPDVFSLAAPVRDHTGQVVAALSITGPASRLDADRKAAHRDALLRTAAALCEELGWNGRSQRTG